MDVRPLLDPHGRQWRASPLTFIRHGLGPLSPILLGFLICLLLWLLEQDASLKQVAAGIAIFLFGMFFLEQGFGQLLSGQWRRGLRQLTASRSRSFMLGFLATLLTQSSALIALLLLSFLSAGMVDFLASIAIMAGASLGTTSGGWLMASLGLKLGIGDYALPMLVVGMLLISMPRWGSRGLGMVIAGVGFLFLGIDYIKNGFLLLSSLIDLRQYAQPGWGGILLYAGAGVLLTLVMQSSHASLLLCMAALTSGQLPLDHALALVLGINVGATGPVLLGAVHSAEAGQRLALLDLLFKSATALLCLLAFIPLCALNEFLATLLGLGPDDLALRLALFHTLFNLLAVAWLLPSSGQWARLMVWLLPNRIERQPVHACYLNRVVAAHPTSAEQALVRELLHLLQECQSLTARAMLGISYRVMMTHPNPEQLLLGEDLPNLQRLYLKSVKPLFGEIITFAALCKANMDRQQAERVDELVAVARSLSEVIRLQRQLQVNLLTAFGSGSDVLQLRYQALLRRLLMLNRELRALIEPADPQQLRTQLALEVERVILESRRDREDIELLIRSNKLDAIAAAGLMNDAQTLRRIQRQQLKAVLALFTTYVIEREFPMAQLVAWLRDQEQRAGSCEAE